jgi:hypothetical protein
LDSFIVYDRETGKPRGFGFVTFEDPAVCLRLLKTITKDGSSSNDEVSVEETATVQDTMTRPAKLIMRGRLIEIKVAQPRETEAKWNPHQHTFKPPRHLHNQYWRSFVDTGMYNVATKYPATLPQNTYGYSQRSASTLPPTTYGYDQRPMTPVTHGSPMMTPATPAQAVLDMAHHMLFYAQLLATPSLSSSHLEPMLSTCNDSHFYQNERVTTNDNHKKVAESTLLVPLPQPTAPPALPDVMISPSKLPRETFKIGGATFYPDLPPTSPTALSSKATVQGSTKALITSINL